MGKGLYDWIRAAFDKGYVTKNGTFTSADFNYKAQSALTFSNALMTEVTVPKLDGSSKDAAYFHTGFEAEQVRWAKGGGEDIRGKIGPKQKAWLCSNFRVEIGAYVDASPRWTRSWKCAARRKWAEFSREPKHPAKVTVPDLKLGISYADHQAWADAAKKWFIDGERLESHEMQGSITFLGPDMKAELGRIDLMNIGFKKFSDEDAEANSEKIKRFNVELYVEKMVFNLKEFDS